jgi:ferredoxin, 2Fe-2S
MSKVNVTTREGQRIVIDSQNGVSLMEAIRAAGIEELLAICGGNMSCATCHVYVDAADIGRLDPMSADEADLLESTGVRKETSRLSCQIVVGPRLNGLRVRIAPEP